MAKKEQERKFLNAPLPQANKKYKSTRVSWGGLNLSNTYNSGQLSYADGVSTSKLPYLQTDTSLKVKEYGMADYNKEGYTVLGAYQNSDLYVIVYSVNTIKLDGDTPITDNDTVVKEYGCISTNSTGDKHGLMTDIIDVSPDNGEYSVYADVYVKEFDVYKATISNDSSVYRAFDRKESYKRFKFTLCQYPRLYVIPQSENFAPTKQLEYEHVYNGAIYRGETKSFKTREEAFKFSKSNFDIDGIRSLSMFNIYENPSDPVGTEIDHRVLIFPDKCSLPSVYKGLELTYTRTDAAPDTHGVAHASNAFTTDYDAKALYYCLINGKFGDYNYQYVKFEYNGKLDRPIMDSAKTLGIYPDIIKATTKDSRLYGVTKSDIYVSGFNNYADMNLDTVLYSNSAGAWMVTTKASEESTGVFTAVYPFSDSVVAFKEDFMYTVTGTVNPFRLNEIGNVGCVDMRSICDEDGRLYFAAQNGIYMYRNGYLPTCISTPLMLERITKAVAYIEHHRYHVNIDGDEYIYDIINGTWTRNIRGIEYVAVTNEDIIAPDGKIYNLSATDYRKNWRFETDYMNGYTSDAKKLCKLQLMYEASNKANIYIYINTGKGEEIIYRFTNPYRETKVKCARVLLRISDLVNYSIGVGGNGYCKIHALELISEGTGEIYADD